MDRMFVLSVNDEAGKERKKERQTREASRLFGIGLQRKNELRFLRVTINLAVFLLLYLICLKRLFRRYNNIYDMTLNATPMRR